MNRRKRRRREARWLRVVRGTMLFGVVGHLYGFHIFLEPEEFNGFAIVLERRARYGGRKGRRARARLGPGWFA